MKPALQALLDLSPKEQKFLDVLCNLKISASVSKIAQTAGIPRSTALYLLRKFQKRSLARKIQVGKRIQWMYDKKLTYADKNLHKLKN